MGNNRRIAFLCHPYHRGGVTRWMADAAIAYAAMGIEVYFITVAPVKEFFSAKGKETLLQLLQKEKNTVRIISAPVGYAFEFGTPAYRAWVYKKLIVKLPAGIPVILSDDSVVWAAAAALHSTYPIVGVMHADEAHYYELAERYSDKVAVFACVSERVKATTQRRIPAYDAAHIFTIPCGIHLPPAGRPVKSDRVLQLAFVGRISAYQKRAGDLLKIAALLAQKGTDFKLTITGDGELKAALESQAAAEGLTQVTFTGWLAQKEVATQLSGTDILLLTSDFEGTPIAMMEAFAAGCGMVGTRVSGIEDYEQHPLAAPCLGVYAVGDITAAVQQIEKIAAIDANTRQTAARRLAETAFSMQVCLDKYLTAIDTIKPHNATAPEVTLPFKQLLYSRIIAAARQLKVKMIPS